MKRAIILGVGVWGVLLLASASPLGAPLRSEIDATALLIALGACAGAVVSAMALARVLRIDGLLRTSNERGAGPEALADELCRCAELVESKGVLALSGWRVSAMHPLCAPGVDALINGLSPEKLRELLEGTHDHAVMGPLAGLARMLRFGSRLAPVLGVAAAGAILLALLKRDGLSPLGGSSAQAGAALATLAGLAAISVTGPLADRVQARSVRLELAAGIVIEGFVGLAAGDRPGALRSRLAALLAPPTQTAQPSHAEGIRGQAA